MASSEIQPVDLENEVLLRIGNPDDPHVVPWSILKKVGNSLEALVLALAKYSGEIKVEADLEDFKLDFAGFYDGSAIPAFRLNSQPDPNFFRSATAKRAVNDDFLAIMEKIDKNDYRAITDLYQAPEAKNEVLKKVYEFTNSAGNKPVSIVQRDRPNHYSQVYKVRKLQQKVMKSLLVDAGDPELEPEETSAIARMVFTKSGKLSKKPKEVFDDKEAVVAIKYDQIEFLERRYVLSSPIYFQLYKEGSGFIIENEQLDLFASGPSKADAKIELYSQFDHTFTRLNELRDDQLSNKFIKVKQFYNLIVRTVTNI